MRATCLINSYNYRDFVGQAIDSALAQTHPFDEILVVDDGSPDGTFEWLQKQYRQVAAVRLISKPNGGQLSCFNEGLRHARGDVLFFLDADDRYRPEYVARAMELYQQGEANFVIAGAENFGSPIQRPRAVSRRRDLGISTISALLDRHYVGGPTSTLSMHRSIVEQVLPYPDESAWRVRADDVLVLGSSIVGARKYHLGKPLVEYRIHGNNNFCGSPCDALQKLQHGLAVTRLVDWYAARCGYQPSHLGWLLHREFATIEHPTRRELLLYLKRSLREKLTLRQHARQLGQIVLHHLRQRFSSSSLTTPSSPTTAGRPAIEEPDNPLRQQRRTA